MFKKYVVLDEKTRILLNKVRSVILKHDPSIKRVTDDFCISEGLKKYLEVEKNA